MLALLNACSSDGLNGLVAQKGRCVTFARLCRVGRIHWGRMHSAALLVQAPTCARQLPCRIPRSTTHALSFPSDAIDGSRPERQLVLQDSLQLCAKTCPLRSRASGLNRIRRKSDGRPVLSHRAVSTLWANGFVMEVDVAIIGAGPYGLSVAAHLRAAGVDHRIFGRPMETCRHHMPGGMLLKSDSFASNLYDPAGEYPLSRFCGEHAIEYSDDQMPVPLETFIDCGRAFRHRFASNLEETAIHSLRRHAEGFAFCLENGTSVRAAASLPQPASDISGMYRLRSARLRPGLFRTITIIVTSAASQGGVLQCLGGASAIDMAALLKRRGCDVTLICRREN